MIVNNWSSYDNDKTTSDKICAQNIILVNILCINLYKSAIIQIGRGCISLICRILFIGTLSYNTIMQKFINLCLFSFKKMIIVLRIIKEDTK